MPDPAVRAPRPVSLGAAYRDVARTVRNMRGYGGIGTFILATILYMDAANTAVANMALYGTEVFGMGSAGVRNLLLFSTVFAIVGSAAAGLATDRIGPKRVLLGVLALWLVAIALVAVAPAVAFLFVAGPLVGIALGGTWTVSRVMLVALAPPEMLGEFFGLFALAGRVSAVLGPAITAGLLFAFGGLGSRGLPDLHRLAGPSSWPAACSSSSGCPTPVRRRPSTGTSLRRPRYEPWGPADSPQRAAGKSGDMRNPEEDQPQNNAGDRPRLVALRGRVVTDYEVWPEGTVLLEGGAIADVEPR